MSYNDLINPALGGVVGFLIAQITNLAKLGYWWVTKPKLVIELVGKDGLILAHGAEVENGEYYDERTFGFYVRNTGRSIAKNVRFQVVEMEKQEKGVFSTVSGASLDLMTYSESRSVRGETQATLVPGAAVLISLAHWREDYGVVIPDVKYIPEYYSEICEGAEAFSFLVVAFDEKDSFAKRSVTISGRF